MIQRRRRQLGALILAAVAGCSRGAHIGAPGNPYLADLRFAKAHATSDFERTVLSDLVITRAEYEEAVHRYVGCMRDHGLDMAPVPEKGGYFSYDTVKSNVDFDSIDAVCRPGTVALIEQLYVDQLRNPRKANMQDAIATCLVKRGAAPAGYTGEMLTRDTQGGAQSYKKGPAAQACFADPFSSATVK